MKDPWQCPYCKVVYAPYMSECHCQVPNTQGNTHWGPANGIEITRVLDEAKIKFTDMAEVMYPIKERQR